MEVCNYMYITCHYLRGGGQYLQNIICHLSGVEIYKYIHIICSSVGVVSITKVKVDYVVELASVCMTTILHKCTLVHVHQ